MTALTRAPLLRRIIKMMKVSNQSCSTIVKQVLRRFHHFLPLPWVMSTVRHGQRFTQSEGRGKSKIQDYSKRCKIRFQQHEHWYWNVCFTVAHTFSEAGLWLHWVWLFFFHFFWFRLRWLIVHCATHWRIPIIQSTHHLVENYNWSSVTKPQYRIYRLLILFHNVLGRNPYNVMT